MKIVLTILLGLSLAGCKIDVLDMTRPTAVVEKVDNSCVITSEDIINGKRVLTTITVSVNKNGGPTVETKSAYQTEIDEISQDIRDGVYGDTNPDNLENNQPLLNALLRIRELQALRDER